jgi:hypothetical protein
MRLNRLNEAAAHGDWEFFPNTGQKHGGACPLCGKLLKNRYRGMGPPSYVGCEKHHGFELVRSPKKSLRDLGVIEPEAPTVAPEPEAPVSTLEHSCRSAYRKPDDEDWARRNMSRCEACAEEYEKAFEDEMEAGWVGDAPAPENPATLGDVADKAAPKLIDYIKDLIKYDPRQHHKPGPFGTGRPASIKASDSPVVAGIKSYRDRLANVDPVTGKGKRSINKSKCGFQHTCTNHPSGKPAWNYPMPDPMATEATGKHRYNKFFEYKPTSTFEWPVSGMMGFEPKLEYEDYVKSKINCKVCNGEAEECGNQVAHEYGAAKPYCTEHMMEDFYPAELMKKYGKGMVDAPDPNQDHRDTEKSWKSTRAKYINQGDRVKLKKDTGTVLEVVSDDSMADRTHRVKWDNPKTAAREVTWVDPETLDVIE